MKTLGGRQFWGDVLHFRGWRIQQNIYTRHYRLLDERDCRHAFGRLETCKSALHALRIRRGLPPQTGKAVILVHGIIRSSKAMSRMNVALKNAGWLSIGFDYPSTRVPIPESAKYLCQLVESLDGIEEIAFVTHSLGGLVVRSLLQSCRDPRIRRVVMLGVPNRGAWLADMLRRNLLFRGILGPAGQQLISDSTGFVHSMPSPWCEFGIIAGGRAERGYNPLLQGDDDSVVTVESTRLPGASDFLITPGLHTFLPGNPLVIEHTLRFLETGAFREDGTREPIPLAPSSAQLI